MRGNSAKRAPTRSELLQAIDELQGLTGLLIAATTDRNPNRAKHTDALLRAAHNLCIEARSDDPPEVRAVTHGRLLAAVEAARRAGALVEEDTRRTAEVKIPA